ncbi:potassium transporter TrkA [Desulfovibrio sulfodismutans]|uniref:Potassium transporter TrkA n=1 Tax=Desulfolutivibrio sulfodismutans TaxID=63561 RepID=A0A7K3NJB5_9BACT|nr:potassium transporter TrkA [Desulfolutivibrio sulfodismutans]NDY56291.1 potassium transporter TrkA [Desulfolutivibrio sulfodismutans]QLA13581.1 potassium transporter TrkA [Desulfolutivibrio sulfodismutans DSM 3696]
MNRIRMTDTLRYKFDSFMSRGSGALILGLFTMSAIIILIASTLVVFLDLAPEPQPLPLLMWGNLMRLMDAGTLAGDSGDWSYLVLMLLVTAGGVFIFSSLIGVLTTGLEARLEELRKGRSLVAETGHSVILGWSPHIFALVSELSLANESQGSFCIAIMAQRDKVEMQDELRDKISLPKGGRLVCRTGDPTDVDDLAIVNPGAAKSILIITADPDDPDAVVLKTVLALSRRLDGVEGGPGIAAVLRSDNSLSAATIAGAGRAVFIPAGGIVARIMAQTCRQPGLSAILTDLLDFSGDEIYMHADQRLTGKTYGRIALSMGHGSAMGLRTAAGEVLINPPADTVFGPGDALICLAQDDSMIALSDDAPAVDASVLADVPASAAAPERLLILGWNQLGPLFLASTDEYAAPGSDALIVAPAFASNAPIPGNLRAMRVESRIGEVSDPDVLQSLSPQDFDHVMVFSDPSLPLQSADARTLAILLHLRAIADRLGRHFPITTQILDDRNHALAQAARADDFIVSDRLLSMMLAQVSENPELLRVFGELFRAEGSELYLKPASSYVREGCPVNFATVIQAALRRGESALGWRSIATASDAGANYGVRLNPGVRDTITFAPGDRIVVLAEDDG